MSLLSLKRTIYLHGQEAERRAFVVQMEEMKVIVREKTILGLRVLLALQSFRLRD